MSNFEQTHERFLSKLSASQAAVWRVAMWLADNGITVQVNGLHRAPTRADARAFTDLGDLEVMHRVEVKQLGAEFTCREDWPFPDFLVCSKSSYDRAVRKPRFFYYLNRAATHVAALDVRATHDQWATVTRQDNTYDDVGGVPAQTFYACSPDVVSYWSIE